MDLLQTVRKEGSRGGRGEFKWEDVKNNAHRENYLGHSLMAPVGRWQQGKDLSWYTRGESDGKELGADEARRIEIRKVKEAEADALARALGYEIPPRQAENPNMTPMGGDASVQKAAENSTNQRRVEVDEARERRSRRDRHEDRHHRRSSREGRGDHHNRHRHERHHPSDRTEERRRRAESRSRSRSGSRSRHRRRRDRDERRPRSKNGRSPRHNRDDTGFGRRPRDRSRSRSPLRDDEQRSRRR